MLFPRVVNDVFMCCWECIRSTDIKYSGGTEYSGTFPTEWNIGVIKPIHEKRGDRRTQANYRGITLTSCLGKLFTPTLRLLNNTTISIPSKLELDPCGTTDSLLRLQQLFDKYTKQHKELFVGFIDYESAFDSVWQSILGDPGANSWSDGIFTGESLQQEQESPWAFTLTERVPEAFEIPPSDFLANHVAIFLPIA